MPADPTPEQLDAWVELAQLMRDASFVESMRDHTREVWTRGLDMPKFRASVRQHFDRQDPRETRYWQLVGMLKDRTFASMIAGMGFVISAVKHHLPAA